MSNDDLLPPNNSVTPKRSTKPAVNNEILKAYQVNAFKYVNKQYENRGKVGLALLRSKISNTFNILLYGKGNSHITQANVNSEFEITSAEELYVSFYDIKSENWSLRFDQLEYFKDFLSRVCIYKMISSNKPELVIIDLKSGTGTKVQEPDMCEVELTINSIKNYDISSVIYSSDSQDVLRTQVGSNKIMQAIELGLIGMSKGGYRVIAVPHKSSLIKGGSISVPGDTNILVYIRLIRSKSKMEKPNTKVDGKDVEMPLPDIDFVKSEPEIDIPSSKKDLMNRLAEMVKPIPPSGRELNTNDNFVKNYSLVSNNEIGIVHPSFPYSNQLLPFSSINPPQFMNPQINPVNSYASVQNLPASNDFSVLFTETRQNNTEMRVALSKLQDKLDRIHEKIDMKTVSTQKSVTRYMDAENVFENIKRIINENESLKLECTQKSDMIEKQNKRISEMQKTSQLYLEESHDVIHRKSVSFNSSTTEHENRILQLEEDKLNLIRNLSQKTSEVSQMEMKLEQATTNAQAYRTKSLEFNDQITKFSEEIGDLKLKNRSLLTELNDIKALRNSDSILKEELETHQKQWSEDENSYKNKIDVLKSSLNQLNNRINKIRTDCEAETNEIRQQYGQEIEEWKNKLKLERQRISNKSSNLQAEIDQINQSWEQRFEDYRQNESGKSIKLNERNSQLMLENANLNREIIDLKNQVSVTGNIQSTEVNELKIKNKTLSDQFYEIQKKLTEFKNLEVEFAQLKEDNKKLNELNANYNKLQHKNDDLEREMVVLIKEHGDVLSKINNSQEEIKSPNIEEKVKKIMNDVFKKIKQVIDSNSTYSGKEVVNKCLIIIRDSTMEIIGGNNQTDSDEEDEEDEEEEEGEGEGEETLNTDELKTSGIKNVDDFENLRPDNEIVNEDETEIENLTVISEVTLKSSESELNLLEHETRLLEDNMNNLQNNVEEIINHSMKHEEGNEILDKIPNETFNSVTTEFTNTEKEDLDMFDQSKTQNISPEPSKSEVLDQSNLLKTFESEKVDPIYDINDNSKTTDINVEQKKDTALSSDEDDNVLDFFEKLSQKTKNVDIQPKNIKPKSSVSDFDDELSWLHN